MTTTENNRRKLYNALSRDYDDIGSWDEFNAKMNDESSRRKLYNALSRDYDDFGTWDEFNARTKPASKAPGTAPSVASTAKQPSNVMQPQRQTWTKAQQMQARFNMQKSVWGFNNRINARKKQVRRMVESNTPKGRERAKAGKTMAQAAGTPTKLLGLTPPSTPTQASTETASAYAAQSVTPSIMDPQPYGVKKVNGKLVTEWLMPDGSLTTDISEADTGFYTARKARNQFNFERRMRENGLNVANQNDVKTQAMVDAIHSGYGIDVAERTYIVACKRLISARFLHG
ncbi:MAG: hypothetical protein NC217_08830 [Muribaculaceae bacterium]|nr:hypothetical protein [Muribaculaceae bacterium]